MAGSAWRTFRGGGWGFTNVIASGERWFGVESDWQIAITGFRIKRRLR